MTWKNPIDATILPHSSLCQDAKIISQLEPKGENHVRGKEKKLVHQSPCAVKKWNQFHPNIHPRNISALCNYLPIIFFL
jgi:hypothetical protein